MPSTEFPSESTRAIVLCVEGERYRRTFERMFLPGIRAFAHRHGYTVILADGARVRGDLSADPARRPVAGAPASWMKIYAIQAVQALGFERVLYLDADVFVSPTAEDYFSLLPGETVSAILEETIPAAKVLLWRAACGLPPSENPVMINAGVIYLAGEAGRQVIREVTEFIDQNGERIRFGNRVFEQPILSEFFLASPAFKRMRYLYNTLLYSDRGYRRPEVQRMRSLVNSVCSRVPVAGRFRRWWFAMLAALPGRYAGGNRSLITELLAEGRFIHLAGMNDEQGILQGFVRQCTGDAPDVIPLHPRTTERASGSGSGGCSRARRIP